MRGAPSWPGWEESSLHRAQLPPSLPSPFHIPGEAAGPALLPRAGGSWGGVGGQCRRTQHTQRGGGAGGRETPVRALASPCLLNRMHPLYHINMFNS